MSNKPTAMTPSAARRIQSAAAKANNGKVAKGSFAARATSAAISNVNDATEYESYHEFNDIKEDC